MKKSSSVSLSLLMSLLAGSLWWWNVQEGSPSLPAPPEPAPIEDISFLQQPSAIGTAENPVERQQWEQEMLRDPKTGRIPENMRERELQFASHLPDVKSADKAYRRAGLKNSLWIPAGPANVGGRTRAVALDVTDEGVILAGGVSGGMWRSDNSGQSWVKTTSQNVIQSVTCLTQDTRPGKTDTWYYGTGELIGNSARGGNAPYRGDGIFKSTDGGRTWALLPATSTNEPEVSNVPFDYIFNLKVNTANQLQDELYAACIGGIVYSPDGGSSWQAALFDDAALFTDVAISPTGVLYASMSAEKYRNQAETTTGVFRSVNGVDWQNITPAGWPSNFGRTVIDINPRNENEVYFLAQSDDGDRLWRYRHTNPSGSWTDLSSNLPDFGGETGQLDLQGGYNMVVKAHPGQDNVLFLGGTNLYRSTDGFSSPDNTAWIGGYDTTGSFSWYRGQHPDQHALLFYPSNPARSISGHDGGLSITENILAEDVSWDYLNESYVTSQFYTIGLDQNQTNNIIIGGLQDNGSQITQNGEPGAQWQRILGGDGGYTHVALKGSYYYVSFQKSQIYRLTLNEDLDLTSFARIDPPGAGLVEEQEYLFINPYVIDPNNNNRMYLAAGNVVYRNNNLSQIDAGSQEPSSVNWDELPQTAIDSGSISAISVSNLPANVLYYGTNRGQLFRADSADSAKIQVRPITSPLFPNGGYNAHISINPINSEEIMVIFSNYNTRSIFHSINGGETFTDVGGNLEENVNGEGSGPSVRYAEIIPLQTGQNLFLVGTSTGVYSALALDGANTNWVQEGPDVIGEAVAPQMRYRSLDGRVVVATHGNGVYYKNFDNVLPVDRFSSGRPFSLNNPYPNPVVGKQEIRIPFNLPESDIARVRILNMQGQVVRTLTWSMQNAGNSVLSWDCTDYKGIPVQSGTYIVQLEFQDQAASKRLVIIR